MDIVLQNTLANSVGRLLEVKAKSRVKYALLLLIFLTIVLILLFNIEIWSRLILLPNILDRLLQIHVLSCCKLGLHYPLQGHSSVLIDEADDWCLLPHFLFEVHSFHVEFYFRKSNMATKYTRNGFTKFKLKTIQYQKSKFINITLIQNPKWMILPRISYHWYLDSRASLAAWALSYATL